MTQSEMPNNAPDWAAFLLNNQLPSPFKVGQQALRTLEKETLPYAKLAQQINADPVLSFYLMDAAARLNGDDAEYSKTLDHAMSMIGIDAVKESIRKVPLEDASLEEVQSLYFVKTLNRSLFCAHLARRIANDMKMAGSDTLFWSGLFVYVPIWYLWRFATPEMRLMRYAVETNHKAKTQAQDEVMNCSVADIASEMMKQLALPPLVKSCYDPENQVTAKQWVTLSRHLKSTGKLQNNIESRELKVLVQQPVFIVQLAKLIADAALNDWYDKATLRAQKILAAYLNISIADASRLTHKVAADMSRQHPIPGILSPAARLFLPATERKALKEKTETTKASSDEVVQPPAPAKPEPAVESAASEANDSATQKKATAPKAIYTEMVTAMYKTPQDFADLHELMNASTSALVYGLGLGRATISLVNKEHTRLKTYYATGCQEQPQLSGFDSRLVKGTLFAKLCSKAASVWIKPTTDIKVSSLVPSSFKQIVEIEDYFLMSIFVNNKPFAIVYCDAFPHRELTEMDYKYFKYLCKGISGAMDYLVRNKGKSKETD